MSSAELPRRLKCEAIVMSSNSSEDYLHYCVSNAVAETRAATLTEPLRKSGDGREDDSNSDSDEEVWVMKCREYDESYGRSEDDFNLGSDDEMRL